MLTWLESMKPRIAIASGLLLLQVAAIGCGRSTGTAGSGPASFAAIGPVSGPLIGYVWDPIAPGLRPIFGVSGAARLGAALYANRMFSAAAVSVAKQFALLTSATGEIYLTSLPAGEPSLISPKLSSQQQIAISPSGNAAIIFADDLRSITLITGLPASPVLQTVELPAIANQAAVSDSGLVLIATTLNNGTSNLRSLTASGATAPVTTLSQFGAMAFLPKSTSALIADAGQNGVQLASGLGGALNISRIATSADGVAKPVAVASSSDARWAIIANQTGSSIVLVDLSGKTPSSSVQCNCSLAFLMPIAGNDVFRLTELGAGPLSIFDGNASKPRVFLIAGIQDNTSQGMVR
jgi:hypothetical protein